MGEPKIERDPYIKVISLSADSALAFFGYDATTAHAVDAGPAPAEHPCSDLVPGARLWHVYPNKGQR